MSLFLVCIAFIFASPQLVVGLDDCSPTRCRRGGPLIQFPFRHKDLHPQRCGYPGFDLYCDENQETALVLPVSVNVFVTRIDYVSQTVRFDYPGRCLPQNLQGLNLSASPFNFTNQFLDDYILLNCSASPRTPNLIPIPCLGVSGYEVYAVRFSTFTWSNSFTSCTRIYGILSVPSYIFDGQRLQLTWSEPACSQCERQGKLCSPRNGTGGNQIECTDRPQTEQGSSKTALIAGAIVGSFFFVATLGALYYLYSSIRTHKRNLAKIETFLEDYKALKPTRFSYGDIKRITNQFSEKLGEGGYGVVYKGKLSKEIYVAVKVLNDSKGNGEEFINEVGTIGRIHHVNVVRLVGYCAEGLTRALVYDYLPNDSLEKFIFKKNSLGWEKLQDIALGIAKGIEYLHLGCDQQILHFDIKPQNILLDHNFNPKVSDFGLAKLCSKDQSAVSMTAARGTVGYIAPEVLSRTFGRASSKSDVYSFGMLLLEIVGGRKNADTTMNTSQTYFPRWIYSKLIVGEEIFAEIEKGEESKIVRKLTIVGLWCIQWYPTDRPSMKMVVHMLEGHEENLTMPPNPFPTTGDVANSVAAVNGKINQIELAVVSETE